MIFKIKLLLIYAGILKRVKVMDYSNCELTFIDDFDNTELDGDKWMTHYFWGHNIVNNDEIQWYTHDAFTVKNSVLHIHLEKRSVNGWVLKDGDRESKAYHVTSGLIHTGEFFKQKYGRFEIKCKFPIEEGFLPSFWLINPASYPPEIDVFDFTKSDKNSFNTGFVFGRDIQPIEVFQTITPVKLDGWNIFTLDWEPHKLTWYMNGHKIYETSQVGIPQTPMYVAINLAANNETQVEKIGSKIKGLEMMSVDWIKVYQFKDGTDK